MVSLVFAAIAFVAIHIGIAGTRLRDRMTAQLGEGRYRLVFSIASALAIIWLVFAYNHAPYRETWGMLEWWKPVAIVLMLPSFLLVVIGLTTPTPTTMGQEARASQPVRGILRITRHPFLSGVSIWAFVHLVGNGDAASLIFFGTFLVVSSVGMPSIDAKRERNLGETGWGAFRRATSAIPFAAIASGRNVLRLGEISIWRWAAGLAGYVLMLGGHLHIVGVSPFPT